MLNSSLVITEFRITKYNPQYRNEQGCYVKNEWTSYSDVGKSFDDEIFTEEQYINAENSYINSIKEIIEAQQLSQFTITNYEKYFKHKLPWFEKMVIKKEAISKLIQDCLREKCWCRLVSDKFFVHFGYDYYMYVGCIVEPLVMENICSQNGLYCEIFDSPYHEL